MRNPLYIIRISRNLILISLILIIMVPINIIAEQNSDMEQNNSDKLILLESDEDTINTVTDMNEKIDSNLTGNNESVNNKRQKNGLSFYNTLDMLTLHTALLFAVTIVGIPIAIYILILYGINWLFNFGFKKLFLEDAE